MQITEPLFKGKLLKRYKRFLADIQLDNGDLITAHTPNTGSMKQCSEPGSEVIVSISSNLKRKYAYTWQMVKINDLWCCVNTIFANKLTHEALQNKLITSLAEYDSIKPEQKYSTNSRIDFLLEKADQKCYIEVKNVTLIDGKDTAIFPDAVTTRGQKHLMDLQKEVENGNRAIIFYVIQRQEARYFDIAREIDPEYDRLFQQALSSGVEVMCWRTYCDDTSELYLKDKIEYKKRG
jgi:sugar fermentation stimulation protein A